MVDLEISSRSARSDVTRFSAQPVRARLRGSPTYRAGLAGVGTAVVVGAAVVEMLLVATAGALGVAAVVLPASLARLVWRVRPILRGIQDHTCDWR